jgi:hypothetical protein
LVEDERIISFNVLLEWFFGESGLFAFWLWCFGAGIDSLIARKRVVAHQNEKWWLTGKRTGKRDPDQ